MSAMTNFTIKSLRSNKVRTLVTIIGVALAAALLSAVLTSFTSLNGYLYHNEEAYSGKWMSKVYADPTPTTAEQIKNAEQNDEINGVAILQDAGFGELTEEQKERFGIYLPISSFDGSIEDLCAISAAEGRLPETADEIVLPELWKRIEGIKIGDTFQIELGDRRAYYVNRGADTNPDPDNSHDEEALDPGSDPDSNDKVFNDTDASTDYALLEEGAILASSMGYLDAKTDGGNMNEELVSKRTHSFKVVGFVSPYTYALSTGVGSRALIGGGIHIDEKNDATDNAVDIPASNDIDNAFIEDSMSNSQQMQVYLGIKNISNAAQVEDLTSELFPDDSIETHMSLLRYLGVRGDSPVWDTFFGIVALLSIVICAASVSLIYNTFSISITERANQFGLLATIGASKRQLWRSVITEGLIIAAIGIPLGIIIGIGACSLIFLIIGPMISASIGHQDVEFTTSVEIWSIGITLLLTLITVFVSVVIPAVRVSTTSPLAALQSNHFSRVNKRGQHQAAKATNPKKLWQPKGLVSRIFGIGGSLAQKNQKRGAAKGYVASISLALSIVLLITAGSLSSFLDELIGAVDNSADYDISIQAQSDLTEHSELKGAIDAYAQAYESMSNISDVKPVGWMISDTPNTSLKADILNESYLDYLVKAEGASITSNGYIDMPCVLYYLDDKTFIDYAESIGTDPTQYFDEDTPRLIGISKAYAYFDGKYQIVDIMNNTGEIEFLSTDDDPEAISGSAPEDITAGRMMAANDLQTPTDDPENLSDNTAGSEDANVIKHYQSAEIAFISNETPELISSHAGTVQLIAPVSMVEKIDADAHYPIFTAGFNAINGEHVEKTEELSKDFNTSMENSEYGDMIFVSFNDLVAESESTHMIAFVVNLFCILFTGILTLIALANVFNTVSNQMILRRREFAVMRSIGLSGKQFRSMIVNECMNYSLRGFIPGAIVAALLSYFIYRLVGLSMSGIDFGLPWSYVGIAFLLSIATTGISVAYGMHRCKSNNIIEALR